MIAYEQQLDHNPEWALKEGSMHFEKASGVHHTLRKITARLEELGIPYALAGGMALFLHGYRRFTEGIDLLVTKTDLDRIRDALSGSGYAPLAPGSTQVRDAETGVRIKFLLTGSFPGDGKPKQVAFPNPEDASEAIDGIRCLTLPKLVELKLASGMTNPGRLRDLADVQDLIALRNLPLPFAVELSPSVQEKFWELWQIVHENRDLAS